MAEMVEILVVIIVIPVILGQLIRYPMVLQKLSKKIKPIISKICQVLILVMIFKGSAGAVIPFSKTVNNSGSLQILLLISAVFIIL